MTDLSISFGAVFLLTLLFWFVYKSARKQGRSEVEDADQKATEKFLQEQDNLRKGLDARRKKQITVVKSGQPVYLKLHPDTPTYQLSEIDSSAGDLPANKKPDA